MKNLKILRILKEKAINKIASNCKQPYHMIGSGQHTIFIKRDTTKRHSIKEIDKKLDSICKSKKIKRLK